MCWEGRPLWNGGMWWGGKVGGRKEEDSCLLSVAACPLHAFLSLLCIAMHMLCCVMLSGCNWEAVVVVVTRRNSSPPLRKQEKGRKEEDVIAAGV